MPNYNTEFIERYLENKLSRVELLQFEAELDRNPDLREEVVFQKEIVKRVGVMAFALAIDSAHERNVLSEDGLDNQSSKTDFTQSGLNFKTMGIISALIISVLLLLLYMLSNNEQLENDIDSRNSNHSTITDTLQSQLNDSIESKIILHDVRSKLEKYNPFRSYTFLADEGATIVDTQSGTIIKIRKKHT